MNRSLFREVARDPDFEITLVAPKFFQGDLRPIPIEPEPADSALRIVPLKTRGSRIVHLFSYENRALHRLIREGHFDIVHAWEEPYILAGFQIAQALRNDAAKLCFWSLNLGLAWMVFVALLPLGLLQLFESVNHGYYEARELSFLTSPTNRFLEWLRLPGDVVFIAFGVLPLLWLCWLGVRYRRPGAAVAIPSARTLFTESPGGETEVSP